MLCTITLVLSVVCVCVCVCAVPNKTSSISLSFFFKVPKFCALLVLVRYCQSDFEMVPFAPIIAGFVVVVIIILSTCMPLQATVIVMLYSIKIW